MTIHELLQQHGRKACVRSLDRAPSKGYFSDYSLFGLQRKICEDNITATLKAWPILQGRYESRVAR